MEYFTISENPTPGTFGDYILMKQDLLSQDDKWNSLDNQATFNMNFLKAMKEKYKTLHCVYCNKQDLIIYEFHEKFLRSNGATTDHIIPISLDPSLSKDESNCTVACASCNNKKGSNLQPINYPYE